VEEVRGRTEEDCAKENKKAKRLKVQKVQKHGKHYFTE
jgi:hypothetical protein